MSANRQFERVIAKMPVLLKSLQSSPAFSRDGLPVLPKRAIYVFYENDDPLYVGRSNRLRLRLQEHGRPSSERNTATFAFLLAAEEVGKRGLIFQSMQKTAWKNVPEFRELFRRAKDRVSKMKVRVVEVTDPVDQTVFEVYAALALGTPYNDFETH